GQGQNPAPDDGIGRSLLREERRAALEAQHGADPGGAQHPGAGGADGPSGAEAVPGPRGAEWPGGEGAPGSTGSTAPTGRPRPSAGELPGGAPAHDELSRDPSGAPQDPYGSPRPELSQRPDQPGQYGWSGHVEGAPESGYGRHAAP